MTKRSSSWMRFWVAVPPFTLAVACGVKPPGFISPNVSRNAVSAQTPQPSLPALDDRAQAAIAKHEPEAPNPTPPAYRDADGKPQGPGGPISTEARDCGPAHNHCLRANGWFTDALTGDVAHPRVPVFELEGHWYSWKGGHLAQGRIFRTKPATADTLSGAKEVYVFENPPDGSATFDSTKSYGTFPASEKEALTVRRWESVRPYTIDAAAGTFVDSNARTYKISACRIAFDQREVE